MALHNSEYHVFLNFRGQDIRNNFVDYLNTALKQAGIFTFLDVEEIRPGESIEKRIKRGLHGSRMYIAMFSKHYATSPWALEELVQMMELREVYGRTVLPLFVDDVDPSDVENQTGTYGDAFAEYKRRNEYTDKLDKWKEVLRHAADLKGMVLKDRRESEFIKDVVELVKKQLNLPVTVVDHPRSTGIVSRVSNLINRFFGLGDQ